MPRVLAAVEDVEIDAAIDAMRQAGTGILPEQPLAAGIHHGRMLGNGAQPEGIILEFALEVVLVKIGRRINYRPLAVMALELVHEDAHLFQNALTRMAHLATRFAVIFHINDRRQRIWIARYITNEPVRLFAGVTAPVEEVVSTAANTRFLRALPVGAEHRIEMIAAIRRLDEGEIGAACAQLRPINIGLPTGYIHPVDLEMTRLDPAEIDRLRIPEAGAENA